MRDATGKYTPCDRRLVPAGSASFGQPGARGGGRARGAGRRRVGSRPWGGRGFRPGRRRARLPPRCPSFTCGVARSPGEPSRPSAGPRHQGADRPRPRDGSGRGLRQQGVGAAAPRPGREGGRGAAGQRPRRAHVRRRPPLPARHDEDDRRRAVPGLHAVLATVPRFHGPRNAAARAVADSVPGDASSFLVAAGTPAPPIRAPGRRDPRRLAGGRGGGGRSPFRVSGRRDGLLPARPRPAGPGRDIAALTVPALRMRRCAPGMARGPVARGGRQRAGGRARRGGVPSPVGVA